MPVPLAPSPSLSQAMNTIRTKAFVIPDGTLLPINRIAADTRTTQGRHRTDVVVDLPAAY